MSRGRFFLLYASIVLVMLGTLMWAGSVFGMRRRIVVEEKTEFAGRRYTETTTIILNLWGIPLRAEILTDTQPPSKLGPKHGTVNLDGDGRLHGKMRECVLMENGDTGTGVFWMWHGQPVGSEEIWKRREKRAKKDPSYLPQ